MSVVLSLRAIDLRLPTSQHLDGSEAMNQNPDYPATYAILATDQPAETLWP